MTQTAEQKIVAATAYIEKLLAATPDVETESNRIRKEYFNSLKSHLSNIQSILK